MAWSDVYVISGPVFPIQSMRLPPVQTSSGSPDDPLSLPLSVSIYIHGGFTFPALSHLLAELSFPSSSVHRTWKAAACEDHIHMPKIIPEHFASAELVGAGKAGSTKTFHFTPAAGPLTRVKDHAKVLDHGSHTMKHKSVEGRHLERTLKSRSVEVKFVAGGADSCVVKTKIVSTTIVSTTRRCRSGRCRSHRTCRCG